MVSRTAPRSPHLRHSRDAARPSRLGDVAERDPVLADEPRERLTIRAWPGEALRPRVLRWYDDWRPPLAPSSPYGLRVIAGPQIDYAGMRAIGVCPHDEGASIVLIVDANGVHWEQVYRREPRTTRSCLSFRSQNWPDLSSTKTRTNEPSANIRPLSHSPTLDGAAPRTVKSAIRSATARKILQMCPRLPGHVPETRKWS
jgi:hypothetical protein